MAMAEIVTLAVLQGGEWTPKLRDLSRTAKQPAAIAQIAAALSLVGQFDDLRRLRPQLETLDSKDPNQWQPGLVAKALLAVADGRAADGIAQLEAYLAQNPRSLELNYYIGLAHERSGQLDEAIQRYRRTIDARSTLGPNTAVFTARLNLALLLKARGDQAGADEQFAELSRQWQGADPDFAPMQVVRENQ